MYYKILILLIGIVMYSANLFSQQIHPSDLKGKWIEEFQKDTSYFYFLTDSTVSLNGNGKSKICYFKLDSLNGKQRLSISLLPNDTVRRIQCYITRIYTHKISLSYFDLKTNSSENHDESQTRYFLRIADY
jgi:hypothetical protein